MNYCIIMTTCESDEQAWSIIDDLIEKRLAACIQRLNIESSYFWHKEVRKDPEILLLIKTRDDLYGQIKSRLEEIHPYETPEILKLPVSDGSDGYLSWIDEVTR